MPWDSETVTESPPPQGGWVSDSLPEPPKIETKSEPKGWASESAPVPLPMPGPIDALTAGFKSGVTSVKQTATAFSSVAPEPVKETSPAAQPFEWQDLIEPVGRGLPKVAYRTGQSSPTLAAGIAGGAIGAGAGTLVAGPGGTAAGGLGGGVVGAATGAAVQTIGPVFAEELKKTPNDPERAWNSALNHAMISGGFSGAAWAAFPLRFFSGPVKQLAFQAFGVQPAISVAEQATKNVASGQPITENLGQAYTEGAVGTVIPAAGHAVITGGLKAKAPTPAPAPTAQQLTLRNDALAKYGQADALEQLANLPGHAPAAKDALIAQSDAIRREGNQANFESNIPAPIPERGRMAKSWVDNFQPELTSEAALKAEPRVAEYVSTKRQRQDAIFERADKSAKEWYKMPFDDVRQVLEAYELGQPIPAAIQAQSPFLAGRTADFRKWFNEAFTAEKRLGSKASYYQDYFPHQWENPAQARQVFSNVIQSMGPKWFQKARYYDMIEQGLANGLKLTSKNPEYLVANRLMAGVDMQEKMRLLNDMHSQGLAVPAELAPANLLNQRRGSQNSWMEVNAPNSQRWLIAPDVQALWKNGVDAKGLWSNEGMVGSAFRNWMGLKSAWVPIKLGLSAFHPIHVAHISVSNNISRALNETFGKGQQSLGRRAVAIPEAIAQSVMDTALAAPIGTPYIGKRIREAWTTDEARRTPEQRADVQLMNEAGTAPQLALPLKNKAKLEFQAAMYDNQYLKAIWPGFQHAFHKANPTRWIFDQWIPNLKTAAVKREADALFRKDPSLINDPDRRKIAMRAIGKQVDNRFGEMFYGSLFWNRTIKDASIGSFLSLGWNLGFAREFIGGALEPAARRLVDAPTPTRQLIRDTTNKATNAFVYTMTAMMVNAMINKSMTGENPEGMDYIFPRIGGLNPDGSPRRISNPFYTREVPMATKNIEERQSVVGGLSQMLYHKLMFAPFVEMGTNRDYFGRQIYDDNAPAFKQAFQFGKHVLSEQLNPMSITGAKKALELSGKPHTTADVFKQITDSDVLMPLAGFGPAPAYASKSPIQNRISFLFGKYVASEAKPYSESENSKERSEARNAYLMAQQKDDKAGMQEAAQKMAKLGVKGQNIVKLRPGGNIEYMFQRLPESQQVDLLKKMDQNEFKQYIVKASRKTKGDPEVRLLTQYYMR